MHWPLTRQSRSSSSEPTSSLPPPQVSLSVNGVGANYQPFYLPHPAAVPDPYTRTPQPAQSHSPTWQIPRLSLRIEDLSNSGVELFLKNVKPYDAMRDAVLQVLKCLYTVETQPKKFVDLYFLAPGSIHVLVCSVHSVTVILRDFAGAAYTHGSAADKEIHFSTRHIQGAPLGAVHPERP